MTGDQIRADLLTRLRGVERAVRADMLAQYRAEPELLARALARLKEEESELAGRESWLEAFAGRSAVLYILKSLYARVLEDQGLLAPTRIRGGGTYELFRRLFPQLGYAAYLRTVFTDAERAFPELFARTPVEIAEPGEASARALWEVWQEAAAGGGPFFDFRGDELDTRFIGDLYQDLDPEVKARYALLQTPRFIEEFILDRTLDPALADFGLDDFRIIDPTCGSGHFLLGAFERLFAAWCDRLGRGADERWEAAKRALAAVYGADLNEYACALSRFRLLLAVVRVTGVRDNERLRCLHYNVITCDSLIPWERLPREMLPGTSAALGWLVSYGGAAERQSNEAFFARDFHAVVGNPPYIAVHDKKKRDDYRRAWPRSATGKYSLSAPMTERFLLLPVAGGRAGIIVANNFCKRSFGKGVIEKALRDVRLDLVVDTSGAYIPGHGTPTVMLFSTRTPFELKKNAPIVVAGKRGEPREPSDPSHGLVWSAIALHWAEIGYEDVWVAVSRVAQATLIRHPWSLGSDAVTTLKAKLDAFTRVNSLGAEAGPAVIIIEDEAFVRRYARALPLRPIVFGEDVRDWRVAMTGAATLVPHNDNDRGSSRGFGTVAAVDLWSVRTVLRRRGTFGSTFEQLGLDWWCYRQYIPSRMGVGKPRIVIGEIATNNQFVHDASDAVFTQTAPVLTLNGADSERHRDVAAVLNSSALEFWFKQVCFRKGGDVMGEGRVPGEAWDVFYVRNGTNVLQAPLPMHDPGEKANGYEHRAIIIGAIQETLERLASCEPQAVLTATNGTALAAQLARAQAQTTAYRERLVALQEELDWSLYRAFELVPDVPLFPTNEIAQTARGHRPFEIALARRIAEGEEESNWFKRQELEKVTEIPARYTGALRDVLEQRLTLIASDPTIALLEQPVYKRRWTFEPWEKLLVRAATTWLLDALDSMVRAQPRLYTADDLVALLRSDPKAVAIAAFAGDGKDVDLTDTVTRLLTAESIPDNPARLLTPSGLTKLIGSQTADLVPFGTPARAGPFKPGEPVDWKRVWRLQEREDAGLDVTVAVPPPFKSVDYAHPNAWRIRGKFNIANERFIVYDELVPKRYAWGGWTISERARLSMKVCDLLDRQQDAGSTPPTSDDPRRCGSQFALWEKLDELRRTSDPDYDDVTILAQQCGRSCPCDVLDRWRAKKSTAAEPIALPTPVVEVDADVTEALYGEIARSGRAGVTAAALEPLCGGDRAATRIALDHLRSAGRIEAVGRGRATRYRMPQAQLPL